MKTLLKISCIATFATVGALAALHWARLTEPATDVAGTFSPNAQTLAAVNDARSDAPLVPPTTDPPQPVWLAPEAPVSRQVGPELLAVANPPDAARQAAVPAAPTAPLNAAAPEPAPPEKTLPAAPAKTAEAAVSRSGVAGDDKLEIQIPPGTDIRKVLALLSEQGGINILASQSVTGTVSAVLKDVDVDTALAAILKSTGYVARREGRFVYVGTPQDFEAQDRIGTRIFRPNYVTAKELKDLLTPMISAKAGKISVTSQAKAGIAATADSAGGDDFAGGDAVLVQDYESNLAAIEQVVKELDKRPTQVAIEAMILSVKLDDEHQMGIDWQFLRNKGNIKFGLGTPASNLGSVSFEDGGLKFAFLDSSLGAFVTALETIGDTNVIASPRLMCLNKQRAEVLIGAKLGYVSTTTTETSTSQSVEFLEVGTQLRIRPFISSDGLIRMEVHPELSTGTVRIEGGFTLPDKEVTEVTSNIMVPDGCTMIIGGLQREDLKTTTTQVPLLGSIPIAGPLFRTKTENTERREIVVLITPHIVYEPDSCHEGDQAACEFHRRQAVYADKMSPIGKRYLGRTYFRRAQAAWNTGNRPEALRLVDLAIHYDPLSRAAIDLRSDIWAGNHGGDHSGGHTPAGGDVAPWMIDELLPPDQRELPQRHPLDPGQPGPVLKVLRPEAPR